MLAIPRPSSSVGFNWIFLGLWSQCLPMLPVYRTLTLLSLSLGVSEN